MLTKKNSRKETKGVFRIEKHIIPPNLSWGCKKKSSANRKGKTSSSTGLNMSQIVIPEPIPDFDALKDENMLENCFSDIFNSLVKDLSVSVERSLTGLRVFHKLRLLELNMDIGLYWREFDALAASVEEIRQLLLNMGNNNNEQDNQRGGARGNREGRRQREEIESDSEEEIERPRNAFEEGLKERELKEKKTNYGNNHTYPRKAADPFVPHREKKEIQPMQRNNYKGQNYKGESSQNTDLSQNRNQRPNHGPYARATGDVCYRRSAQPGATKSSPVA
ncbi:hypothetical protein DKX38_012154 [Salix brachista]|uniref:Uncharacterized protein n=1 Tax=Salix brachista TaxID=2182728 RepID=A0A5N5LN52_9ROSI|nr:hypothetical protein DKX38_012154 [Salix brachista]